MPMTRAEIVKKANAARWAKHRAKQKPRRASMITLTPANRPEPTHTPDLTFPSSLRLGMMQTEELLAARADREARLRQSERLAGPLKKVASAEESQLRVELISYELELKRRALAACQREAESNDFNSAIDSHGRLR